MKTKLEELPQVKFTLVMFAAHAVMGGVSCTDFNQVFNDYYSGHKQMEEENPKPIQKTFFRPILACDKKVELAPLQKQQFRVNQVTGDIPRTNARSQYTIRLLP